MTVFHYPHPARVKINTFSTGTKYKNHIFCRFESIYLLNWKILDGAFFCPNSSNCALKRAEVCLCGGSVFIFTYIAMEAHFYHLDQIHMRPCFFFPTLVLFCFLTWGPFWVWDVGGAPQAWFLLYSVCSVFSYKNKHKKWTPTSLKASIPDWRASGTVGRSFVCLWRCLSLEGWHWCH